jgi:hypothetical protein
MTYPNGGHPRVTVTLFSGFDAFKSGGDGGGDRLIAVDGMLLAMDVSGGDSCAEFGHLKLNR